MRPLTSTSLQQLMISVYNLLFTKTVYNYITANSKERGEVVIHPKTPTQHQMHTHTQMLHMWPGMIVFHFIFHQDLPGTVRLRLSCLSSRFLLAFGCKYNCGGGSAACCSAAYLQKMGWWLFRWVTFQHYLHIWYSLIQNISFATDWLLTCPGYVTVYIQQAKALT